MLVQCPPVTYVHQKANEREGTNPANTTHRPNVGPMLAHRLRRRPHIGPTLGRCVLFAGNPLYDLCQMTLKKI